MLTGCSPNPSSSFRGEAVSDEIDYARDVAEAVLDRLGDLAPPWRVLAVERHRESQASPPGLAVPDSLVVTIGRDEGDEAAVRVYFSLDAPREQAVAVTAAQIQDHAIEETGGAALPPCLGHHHPMSARAVDGLAGWVCPQDVAHHREPIVPHLV